MRRQMLFLAACLGVSLSLTPARSVQPATTTPLDDKGLLAAYSGKTHLSYYRRYVDGYGGLDFTETYHAGGAMDYRSGEVVATGRWEVSNGEICFDYADPLFVSACFVVVREAGCYFSYEVGADGVAIGLAEGDWWIWSYIDGTDPDCAAEFLTS